MPELNSENETVIALSELCLRIVRFSEARDLTVLRNTLRIMAAKSTDETLIAFARIVEIGMYS